MLNYIEIGEWVGTLGLFALFFGGIFYHILDFHQFSIQCTATNKDRIEFFGHEPLRLSGPSLKILRGSLHRSIRSHRRSHHLRDDDSRSWLVTHPEMIAACRNSFIHNTSTPKKTSVFLLSRSHYTSRKMLLDVIHWRESSQDETQHKVSSFIIHHIWIRFILSPRPLFYI